MGVNREVAVMRLTSDNRHGVKNSPKETLYELLKRNYEVYVSEISIFELSAKGVKYVAAVKPTEKI